MTGFATGGRVSFAPLGASLEDAAAWSPLGHTITGFRLGPLPECTHEEQYWQGVFDPLEGRSFTFSFKAKRRDLRRMIRILRVRRHPDAMRRSAMRSEYHRRSKRR